MTTITKPAPYTLSLAGRDWAFTPAAVAALGLTRMTPAVFAVVLGSGAVTLGAGLTEVNLGPSTLLVRRSGRRVAVDARPRRDQAAQAPEDRPE